MATVPSYGGPQVAPNAPGPQRFTTPDINPLAIVADQATRTGNQIQGAARELGQAQAAAIEEANQLRVAEAMNKAVQAKLRLTYDPEQGYSNLRGVNALERPDSKALDAEYDEKLQADISKIAEGLGNDRQRQTFALQAEQMRTQFRAGVQQHRGKEYAEYRVGVHKGTILTAQDQMGLAWGDVAAVEQSRGAIKASVAEMGRMAGWSGGEVEAAMREELSKGHAAVLTGAIDAGKLDYARAYLTQYGGDMTQKARLAATGLLDVGAFEERTQAGAEEMWAKHQGDPVGALSEARAKFSGKEEDAVVTRIKSLDAERVTLRERAQKDAADTAWGLYARGQKVPTSVLMSMDGQALAGLRRTQKADAEAAVAKKEVKTDSNIYYLLSRAAAEDPNFKNQDLRTFFDKLAPGDRKHFIDLQSDTAKPEKLSRIATITQQKSTMVDALKLKGAARGVFEQEADKALRAAQEAKGKDLSEDESQRVLDSLAIRGNTPGSFFGTNTTYNYKARAEGRPFTPVWSADQRRRASAALQRNGISNPSQPQIDAFLSKAYPQ